MKWKVAFITVLTLKALTFYAQSSKTGNWWMYIGNQKINNNLNWLNEIQYRNYNFIGDLEQLLLRTGIGYSFGKSNHNALLGYGFINSANYLTNKNKKSQSTEHRFFQQLILNQPIERLTLSHRYRVENRLLNKEFRIRFRYLLSLRYPLTNKEIVEKTLYLSAYNELFINSESPAFDRNRLFAALGYELKKGLRVEAGFMRQIYDFNGRNQFQIIVFNNLNFLM